jgi:hypothetical protein
LVLTGVLALSACSGDDGGGTVPGIGLDENAQHKAESASAGPGQGKSLKGISLCDLVSDKTLAGIGLTRQDGKEKERANEPACVYDDTKLVVMVDYDSVLSATRAPEGVREYDGDKFGIVYKSDSSCQLIADVGKEQAQVIFEQLYGNDAKVEPCGVAAGALKDILAKAK